MGSDKNPEDGNQETDQQDQKQETEADPKNQKEEENKLEKEKKEKEKEEKKKTKLMEKSKLHSKNDDDSLNSGAMLLQVNKIGSEADLSDAPKKPPRQSVDMGKEKKAAGPQMLTKVMLLDGTDIEFRISKNATGKELVDKVCENINLVEKDYFSCTYRQGEHKVWLDHLKPILKQLGKAVWVFAFEVKFYPPDPTMLKEEITRYQLYLQARVNALNGKLPCSFVTHAILGSLATQSQLGDYDVDAHGGGYEYLKAIRFAPGQTEELLERIAELHKAHRGESPAESEMQYLNNVKGFALYGVHLHKTKNSKGEEVDVGVCAAGLLIYQQHVRVNRYTWPKIINIAYKRNNFIIRIRSDTPGKKSLEVVETYRLPNVKMAKRLWKLAAEHHTFFRMREPEKADTRGIFWRRSYHFTGKTEYQALQSSDQVNRPEGEGGMVNRATGGRFTDRLRSIDMVEPSFSTERSEETMDYRTMTLDLKRRNKTSNAFDGTDGENYTNGGGGQYGYGTNGRYPNGAGENGTYNPNDPEGRGLYPMTDASGRVVYMKSGSVGSMGDVFMTLPGQKGGQGPPGYGGADGDGGASQDDYRGTLGDRKSQVNFISPGGAGEGSGTKYSKTPYPGGPGYITPSGPDYEGYPGSDGQGLLGPPGMYGGASRGGSDASGYGPGSPYYGSDDWLKQQGVSGQGQEFGGAGYQGGYGTGGRDGPRRDSQGNLLTSINITLSAGGPGRGDGEGGAGGMYQDDRLNQEGVRGAGGEEGQWSGTFTTSTTKTSTRTYTAPDGTVVTEHRAEKDGVVETHVERRTQVTDEDGGIDYDMALREAIKSVSDLSEDLTVEKIEIQTTKSQDD